MHRSTSYRVVLNSTTDKLIQPAFVPVEEDIVVLAVVDFELMICTVSVPKIFLKISIF